MLDDSDLLSIINSELDNCLVPELERPLDYYLGNQRGDEVEGRSQVISTDVADSIEWLIPQIMKELTQNNEVVVFDPEHEGDEKQAQLETEFVYDQLMKENEGFLILHTFIKDALLHNNGIVKVYYETEKHSDIKEYTGLSDDSISIVASNPGVRVLAHSANVAYDDLGQPYNSHDIRVSCETYKPKVCIENIPPEQFRVNSDHNSVSLKDARFTGHITTKTIGELVEEGFDYNELITLPESSNYIDKSFRFEAQDDFVFAGESADKSMRKLDIGEFYFKADVDETGYARRKKILAVMGSSNATKILQVDDIDEYPWISTASILMGHKFKGLSIYDRIKQIQDIKTSLIRNILDNIYFINNKEWLGVEGQFNPDDFSVSAPGRVKRVRNLTSSVMELQKNPLGGEVYQLLDYVDQMRAGRTGVSAEGSTAPQNVGAQVGSAGVDRLMTAKEELAGLIIRVIAETGIKPLCVKIRDLLVKHFDIAKDYRFRGQWVQVSPKSWPPRSTSTVRVGTGSGDTQKQQAALAQVIALQEKLAMAPQIQHLVDPQKVFDTIDDLCKYSGLTGANRYFIDPSSEQGVQAKQGLDQQNQAVQQKQEQIEQLQLQMQVKMSEAAVSTAQAEMGMVQAKAEADRAKSLLQEEKQGYEQRIKVLEQQLKQAQHDAGLEFKYDELAANVLLKKQEMQAKLINDLSTQLSGEDDGETGRTESLDNEGE